MRAEPRAAPARADLLDRVAAALTWLALPSVDLELVLHPARAAVRRAVVAKRRALALDAGPERGSNAAVKRPQLVLAQLAGRSQRVHPRTPERLIGVDVPDARQPALVEDHGLHRRPPVGESLGQAPRRERRRQRLA